MKALRTILLPALAALALPASATWTFVPLERKSVNNNDKYYDGYVTDGETWSIYVLKLDSGEWQIGCGATDGVNGGRWTTYGSAMAATDLSTGTGTGSGVLDLSTLNADMKAADLDMVFTRVGPRAFTSHSDVTDVKLPDEIAFIGVSAFATCTKLVTLDFSNTKIKRIDDTGVNKDNAWSRGTFQNCTALEEVWLPETVEYIGSYAFTWMVNGKTVVHLPGPVPEFGAGAIGGHGGQYALCVNALKYPNWNSSYATWHYTMADGTALSLANGYSPDSWPVPQSGSENSGWIPERVRHSSRSEYPWPFAYTANTADSVLSLARLYLVQEGEAGDQTPASTSVAVEAGRTNATFTVTAYLGTSSSAKLAFSFNGATTNAAVTADGQVFTFAFGGLDLETTYSYTSAIAADSGDGTTVGSFKTVGPDVKLGATDYSLADDGLSATVTVNVTSLLSESADVALSIGGATVETKTVTATGAVSFDVADLVLRQEYEYAFTATSSENKDVATATVTFTALGYHWTYTANAGGATLNYNGQPYTGRLTDGKWNFFVYHAPDDPDNEIWLGEGGAGSGAYDAAGKPDLDLTGVFPDTGMKIVRVGGFAFTGSKDLASVVFPKFLRHVGIKAFSHNSLLKEIDLGDTAVTNIGNVAFGNCTAVTNVILPRTLQRVGGCAFAWTTSNPVYHFRGDVPECGPTETSVVAWYGTDGADQAFYAGYANRQVAFCVDSVRFPRWKTDGLGAVQGTENYKGHLYDSFPDGELSWIPVSVRHDGTRTFPGGKKVPRPFGNSTLGRSSDTSGNGRAYLIQEYAANPTTILIMF